MENNSTKIIKIKKNRNIFGGLGTDSQKSIKSYSEYDNISVQSGKPECNTYGLVGVTELRMSGVTTTVVSGRERQDTTEINPNPVYSLTKTQDNISSLVGMAGRERPDTTDKKIEVSDIPNRTLVRSSEGVEYQGRLRQVEFDRTHPSYIHSSKKNPEIILSEEQKLAINLFKQGNNIFLTGPGGTGKTLLIKEFVKESYLLDKKIQVCALTGCASLLLGQGARTIHSWSGIKLAKGPSEKIIENALRNRHAKKSWLSTDILVIDEVSMMSHKIINILEELARRTRKTNKIFGGIQVIFCGDFYQLGPIGDQYDSETKEYCFQSKKWFEIFPKENHIQLHTIFRQNDKEYIEILNEIREGKLSPQKIEILKKYVNRTYNESEHNNCYLTKLYPIRSRVDHINKLMFDKIEEPIQNYSMSITTNMTTYIETGKPFDEETKMRCENMSFDETRKEVEQLIANSNLQKELQLKKGTAVMCLTNLDLERGICNGTQGIIIDFVNEMPKVKFSNGIITVITKHYIQSEEYPSIAIGQYPLCLAWAMTIHKMQGATLDIAQIDIGNSIFDYGQTYVGLSRIRSLDGLYLSDFNPYRIKTNPIVQEFYKQI